MKKNNKLFKDKPEIQHRNENAYISSIKELADKIRNESKLDENCFLLKGTVVNKEKHHKPSHVECDYINKVHQSDKPTEKRICRCMHYYGKNSSNCEKCSFKQKMELQNSERYQIIDYEVPMEFVTENVGGIDLEIRDKGKKKEIVYATEVKPKSSHESLVRMIAEILTYTIGKVSDSYKPAICFFEGSCQARDFRKPELQNNKDFQFLLELVDVFYITTEETGHVCKYTIHNNKEEPLCKS